METTIVSEISRLDLQEFEKPATASITDVKLLSSYSWIEAPHAIPTIAVPGSPALWSAPKNSRRLKKDSGLIYIAQNAARHPESPLEPLFRALYIKNPSFDICSTDVVTDRNNIRKLLSFVDPGSTRNKLEEFTIKIEVAGHTTIFCRDEAKVTEYIGPREFRGFGHEFEKAYTVPQISGSTGHHRIISYCFSNLNFIIRHETDGYIDIEPGKCSSRAGNDTDDGLLTSLEALSLSSAGSTPGIIPTGSKLTIREEGQIVPQSSTLEIKTRVSHRSLSIGEVAAQLWVSQTPRLVRAYHDHGQFQTPEVEDVTARIKNWEERKQNELGRLAALIRKIINITKECGGYAVLKYDVKEDKLVIYKIERRQMLPKDLYSKWDHPDDLDTESRTPDGTHGPQDAHVGRENTSAIRINGDDLKAKILIEDMSYSVNVSKIPYFASFIQLQRVTRPEATEFIHEPIDLFDVALKGVDSGYRQCFRSLPIDLSHYRTLFKTYKFLNVDILSGLSLNEVIANLKVGQGDYDPEERRRIPGDKGLARNTAFQFLYLIMYAQFDPQGKESGKLFNAVVFVVSHPGTFKYRTKRIIRTAYEERFTITTKQRASLDQWEKKELANDMTDATTEEEPDYCFDSDCSS
ncbi:MAG: hypothetical protein Q9165_000579 [Trypethelium subeluteriae]